MNKWINEKESGEGEREREIQRKKRGLKGDDLTSGHDGRASVTILSGVSSLEQPR